MGVAGKKWVDGGGGKKEAVGKRGGGEERGAGEKVKGKVELYGGRWARRGGLAM
jgi:hypothetical protein